MTSYLLAFAVFAFFLLTICLVSTLGAIQLAVLRVADALEKKNAGGTRYGYPIITHQAVERAGVSKP